MTPTDSPSAVDADSAARNAFEADWNTWREQNEARRRDPYGFLAYSAIYQLNGSAQRLPGVPGLWSTSDAGVTVELGDADTSSADGSNNGARDAGQLVVDDVAVRYRHTFAPLAEREFRRAARVGPVVIELSRRGGIDLLRPIDPAHGLREAYLETPAYNPDPAWVVDAVFEPFGRPRDTAIEAAVDGITHSHEAVGEAAFELGGRQHRLVFLKGRTDGPQTAAFAVFTDSTSGVTTYRASRTLHTILPERGAFFLDFNRTANLQCAYTDYSPCPLAPAQNRLTVAIEAGEQTPVFVDGRVRA